MRSSLGRGLARLRITAAVLGVLGLAGPGLAFGDDPTCRPVDLGGPRGPMHDMPTFDQPNNTCWAHAAAEMAQAWVQSHPAIPPPPAPVPPPPGGVDFVASPVVLAQSIGHLEGRDTTGPQADGGKVRAGLEFMRQNGACDHTAVFGKDGIGFDSSEEVAMRSKLALFFENYNSWIGQNLDWLRERGADLATRHPEWDMFRTNLETFYEGALKSGQAQALCSGLELSVGVGHLPQLTGKGNLTQLFAAMMAEDRTGDDFLNDYYTRVCRSHVVPMPIPQPKAVGIIDDKTGLQMINRLLDRPNPQPVGIDVCAGMFDHPEKKLRKLVPGKELGCSDSTEHAIVVLGRGRDPSTGRCRLLIRNSWGKGCMRYLAGKSGECNERGDIWVEQDMIGANIYQVNSLE